jgi:valyl-tRNA synthetase
VLIHVLETSLRLLHPYMPFITEELWQHLRQRLPSGWQATDSIVVAAYPEADRSDIDAGADRLIGSLVEIIRSIRNVRTQHKVEANRWIEAEVYGGGLADSLRPYGATIEALTKARAVFSTGRHAAASGDQTVVQVLRETEVAIPMASMVDFTTERERLSGELAQLESEAARLEARLQNQAFLGKAPADVIERERSRLVERQDRADRLRQELARFG